jgi:hypothetical protein
LQSGDRQLSPLVEHWRNLVTSGGSVQYPNEVAGEDEHRNHEERQQREQATDGDGPHRVVAFGGISDRNFETLTESVGPAAEYLVSFGLNSGFFFCVVILYSTDGRLLRRYR